MAKALHICILFSFWAASCLLSAPSAAAQQGERVSPAAAAARALLGYDAWASAPICAAKPSTSNSKADSMGRLWGYEAGASCAFKDEQQQALKPGQLAPALQEFSTAPSCPESPTADNSMADHQGQLWGVSWGLSCGFKTSQGGPAYYISYAGPRLNTTPSPQPQLSAILASPSPRPAAALQPPNSTPPAQASPTPTAKQPARASQAPSTRLPTPIFGLPLIVSTARRPSPSPRPRPSPRPKPRPSTLLPTSPIPSPEVATLLPTSPSPGPSPSPSTLLLTSPSPDPSTLLLASPSPDPMPSATLPTSPPAFSPEPSPAAGPTAATPTTDLAPQTGPTASQQCSCPDADVDKIATAIATQLWKKLAHASNGYETMKAASADAMPPITSDGVREQHQQVLRLSSLLTAIQTLAQQAAQDGTDTAVEATGKAATANSGQATFKASEASNIFKAANTATVAYPTRPSAHFEAPDNPTSLQDTVNTSSPPQGSGGPASGSSIKAFSWIAELQDKKQPQT